VRAPSGERRCHEDATPREPGTARPEQPGTLHLHFGDKDGIARAVALEALAELRARLHDHAERDHATVEARHARRSATP